MSRKNAHRHGGGASGEMDGLDPGAEQLFDSYGGAGTERASHARSRRDGQLCREVQRTIASALGALSDPSLSGLIVDTVEPAPDTARLLVTVVPAPGEGDVAAVLERLRGLAGLLRSEVAETLQRKRTPELVFRLALPASGEEP